MCEERYNPRDAGPRERCVDAIIEVVGLAKAYGPVKAVDGLDFSVERGQLFAFLGPNGAGKSTAIDIMCTFLRPDAGRVTIDGHVLGSDDDKIRSAIGAVFQSGLLDPLLTVEENLIARGRLYGLDGAELASAIDRAVSATDVDDLRGRRYGKLSGGQRRRVDIARALVNTPRILFLDEPTTGLDPQTRRSVWETIKALREETGMTVFLTTHYMEEASEADYVTVIDEGRIVAGDTPARLRERYATDTLRLFMDDETAVRRVLDGAGASYEIVADQAVVSLENTLASLDVIAPCRPYIVGFEVSSGTMDDAFIAITGKELRA